MPLTLKGPSGAKSFIGNPFIEIVANLLVTIETPPLKIVFPIKFIPEILSTSPRFSQLNGGTKTFLDLVQHLVVLQFLGKQIQDLMFEHTYYHLRCSHYHYC